MTTISEVQIFLSDVLEKYYTMEDDNMLDYIDLPLNRTGQIKPPVMYVHALDLEKQDSAYELTPDDLGPL